MSVFSVWASRVSVPGQGLTRNGAGAAVVMECVWLIRLRHCKGINFHFCAAGFSFIIIVQQFNAVAIVLLHAELITMQHLYKSV